MTTLPEELLAEGSSLSVDEAYELCHLYTKERAKSFFYAFSILPLAKRRAILAAYTFAGEADDIADGAGTPAEKRHDLERFRTSLHACVGGERRGPLWVALGDAIDRYAIPTSYFEELARGVEMDLEVSRYRSFEDLWHYCYRVASVVGLICVRVFGYRDPAALEYAVDLGIAMQVTNIMRDVREDAERGRIYLPQEDLERFGVSEEEILGGIYSERFGELMRFEADRTWQYFEKGRKLIPLLGLRSRMCVNTIRGVYAELLERMAARDYDIFSERVQFSRGEKMALIGRLWVEGAMGGPLSRL